MKKHETRVGTKHPDTSVAAENRRDGQNAGEPMAQHGGELEMATEARFEPHPFNPQFSGGLEVQCINCAHYVVNEKNRAGMGDCKINAAYSMRRCCWPFAYHTCVKFKQKDGES